MPPPPPPPPPPPSSDFGPELHSVKKVGIHGKLSFGNDSPENLPPRLYRIPVVYLYGGRIIPLPLPTAIRGTSTVE